MSYFGTLESYIFQGGLYESDRNWTKCLSDNEILLAREINERIIPDLAEDGLFICDFNGNVIAKIDKNGVESVDFTAGGKKLSEQQELPISEEAADRLTICDFNGNVIAKIDKNGVESVDFTAGGKKLSEMTNSGGGGGCTNDIIEHPAYNDSLMITDKEGYVVAKIGKDGVETVNAGLPNTWEGKIVGSYGDSITVLNGGDWDYPFPDSGTKSRWAVKAAKFFKFGKLHVRGVGGSTFNYGTNGGSVCWVKKNTGEFVARNDNYNYDNYKGHVTIPSDCIATRGSGCSWLRITSMFPESIKDKVDAVIIQFHNDFHDDKSTDCKWQAGNRKDTEWAASREYADYNGDYNIETVKGGIASTIMKLQAWMPHATLILMSPISGVYINGQESIKDLENSESAQMKTLAETVKEIAFRMSIPFIDVYASDGINTLNHKLKGYISDGIHPYSDEGNNRIARAVISGLIHTIPNINL